MVIQLEWNILLHVVISRECGGKVGLTHERLASVKSGSYIL